jgi:perosamine synthetase
MRIGRTIPPAASPIGCRDIFNGLRGLIKGQEEIDRFREELKEYFGVKYCFLVSSGKAALTIILKSLHKLHADRKEILIPAFCCYSVPSAIIRAGLKIRLCDVNPDTLDFDFDQLKALLAESLPKKKLLAIIPVHQFGLSSDIEQIEGLIIDSEVTVTEDAAQVMGNEIKGRKLGTIGNVGFFSLGRSKAISAVEGGIIITNDDEIARKISKQLETISKYSVLEQLKLLFQAFALAIFQHPSFFWFPKSLPFLRVGDTIYNPNFKIRKLSALQAGLVREWKAKLSEYSKLRRSSASRWPSIFNEGAMPVFEYHNVDLVDFIRFPVRLQSFKVWRWTLKQSESQGLGIQLTYPDSINAIPELSPQFSGKDFPVAGKLSRQILTLPVHPLLAKKDIAKIESFIKSLHGKAS